MRRLEVYATAEYKKPVVKSSCFHHNGISISICEEAGSLQAFQLLIHNNRIGGTDMADTAAAGQGKQQGFVRGLGLLDSTTMVAGSMIGSGIFIVSAQIGRQVGAPGWLLVVWLITGLLTIM